MVDAMDNVGKNGLAAGAARLAELAVYEESRVRVDADWLIQDVDQAARVYRGADGKSLVLANGLVARTFRISPNLATVSLKRLCDGNEFVRSVRPEAILEFDGVTYPVGGLSGQPVHNYLDPDWLERMESPEGAYHFTGFEVGPTGERFPWRKRLEWMPRDLPWPPPGLRLSLRFAPPADRRGNLPTVQVHYEIYDGIPVLSKWLSFENDTGRELRLNTFVSEILAVIESESVVENATEWGLPELLVHTDYTFSGMSAAGVHQPAVEWGADPLYSSQVNYARKTPCLIQCRPPCGPDQILADGAAFETFRTFVLAHGTTERERRGLELRRMYRVLAPWGTENPVLMHVRSADPAAVRLAIDQCAEVGFEMVIMTFGSGFDFESRDPAYQKQIKELVDYGLEKGIVLGGYSLLASRNAGTPQENTQGSPARFGSMPCLGAQWGVDYLAQLQHFMAYAGLAVLEHDGSYPGDMCAATDHPYHRGLDDSQWVMWKAITDLYKWCRGQGIYLNVPDWYFLNGASKTGMGYREANWSLPRAYQEIIERQNVYDGTRDKTSSMGWMFVPLVEYQGGGPAATIEPLDQHRAHYGQRMANLFGAGVQACYRGPRLYDTEATRDLVKGWVDFYKRHRAVLDGDIIHLRRADGRDIDYLLNVDPGANECGMLVVYNPLELPVTRRLNVPLYYTGLKERARVTTLARIAPAEAPPAEAAGPTQTYSLDRDCQAAIEVEVPARGTSFHLIEQPLKERIDPALQGINDL